MTRQFLGDLNICPPLCSSCGTCHEPEYPHEPTPAFRQHIFRTHGRAATLGDLFSHTTGLIRAATTSALMEHPIPIEVSQWNR